MERNISLSVKCPKCDASLMDERVKFHGKPAVKTNIETSHDRGVLWLSSIYDDHSVRMDIEVENGEMVDIYCPDCNKELSVSEICEDCGAPLVAFVIKAGGVVRICSRKGCNHHHIVFKDVSSEMSKFYYQFGF